MRLGLFHITTLHSKLFSVSLNNVRKFEVANYTPSYYGFGTS